MSTGSTRAKVNHPFNTRVLHKFLESKQEFTAWMKNRIKKYGFVEGVDFISYDNFIKRDTGGTTRKEYDLTIPMAKVLSMVERKDKGRMARPYFISI
jgi:anti-repressor protein